MSCAPATVCRRTAASGIRPPGPVTTAGTIAPGNLRARIAAQAARWIPAPPTAADGAQLIELMDLRGHFLGRIADAERAAAFAEEVAGRFPGDARCFITRSRTGAAFRFESALADLDAAAALDGDPSTLGAERAAIYQALGRYDEAAAMRRQAPGRRSDFSALGARVGLEGERGDMAAANRWFTAARRRYNGISPFPLAMLEFQCGRLWMRHGDLQRARTWCDAAVRRVPAYAAPQRLLAAIDTARDDPAAAIARLRPLTPTSDDPDYTTQLALTLADLGHPEEAQSLRAEAAARYEEPLTRHPEAFSDHAAELWLTIGADPPSAAPGAAQPRDRPDPPRPRARQPRRTPLPAPRHATRR
jgi:tetratricopeptide (TPR) repeat protein